MVLAQILPGRAVKWKLLQSQTSQPLPNNNNNINKNKNKNKNKSNNNNNNNNNNSNSNDEILTPHSLAQSSEQTQSLYYTK